MSVPETLSPPGQATLYTAEKTTIVPDTGGEVTTTDIEFDYSEHLDRIVTALEQISISLSTLVETHQVVSNNIGSIKVLAETTGIKSMSPYDLINAASLYSYYTDNSDDLDLLLAKVQSAPIGKLQSISDAIRNLPKLP
jgi:hypothetical protein